MDKNELIKKIMSFKYISFDMFDTLIFRSFKKPTDVFEAVEVEYNNRHLSNTITRFSQKRQKAELDARKKSPAKEIIIDDIYENLQFKAEIKAELMDIEKQIEILNCCPNGCMLELLKHMQKLGKKIIITTDMYLDKATIENIIYKLHISDVKLFLSSDVGCTKISGKLFPYIINELGCKANEIAHIGDNQISDIKMAQQVGINAFLRVDGRQFKPTYSVKRRNSVVWNHIFSLIRNQMLEDSTAYRVGYGVVGPVLYGFCEWINEQKRNYNAETIVFVAREGYLIEKAYLSMYPEDEKIVRYLALNKNLLRMPILYLNPTIDQLLDTIPVKKKYTLYNIIDCFSYCRVFDKLENTLREYDIPVDQEFTKEELLGENLKELFKRIFSLIKEECELQYKLLMKYLHDNQMLNQRVLLVNNSINGNGQYMLETICSGMNIPINIIGAQFVKSRKCRKRFKERCKAWITDNEIIHYSTMQFNNYALLLEHLLFAPTGTARIFEMSEAQEVHPICESQGFEKKNNELINGIQRKALDFIKDYSKISPICCDWTIVSLLGDLYKNPNRADANNIGNLIDSDMCCSKTLLEVAEWRQATLTLENKKAKKILFNYVMDVHDAVKTVISSLAEHLNL